MLAGGCFWGMEAVFEHVKGVTDVVSGYAGGSRKDANYDAVSTESTGHAEAVRITYDPAQISYAQLLSLLRGRPRPDPGQPPGPRQRPQLPLGDLPAESPRRPSRRGRSSPGSMRRHAFKAPIATRIESGGFYPAEAYHQDFARKHPYYPYISGQRPAQGRQAEVKYPALWKA